MYLAIKTGFGGCGSLFHYQMIDVIYPDSRPKENLKWLPNGWRITIMSSKIIQWSSVSTYDNKTGEKKKKNPPLSKPGTGCLYQKSTAKVTLSRETLDTLPQRWAIGLYSLLLLFQTEQNFRSGAFLAVVCWFSESIFFPFMFFFSTSLFLKLLLFKYWQVHFQFPYPLAYRLWFSITPWWLILFIIIFSKFLFKVDLVNI